MKATVIGIGQTLRGDDAAGVEVVRQWEQTFPQTAALQDVSIHYAELPGLDLLDLLEGSEAAVIVDAVENSGKPGRIHRLGLDELAAFGTEAKSAHGWGVAESLRLGWQINPASRSMRIRLIGIEAQQMDLGQPMSEAVRAVLPAACQAVEEELQALLR